jgi:hypothetical protein
MHACYNDHIKKFRPIPFQHRRQQLWLEVQPRDSDQADVAKRQHSCHSHHDQSHCSRRYFLHPTVLVAHQESPSALPQRTYLSRRAHRWSRSEQSAGQNPAPIQIQIQYYWYCSRSLVPVLLDAVEWEAMLARLRAQTSAARCPRCRRSRRRTISGRTLRCRRLRNKLGLLIRRRLSGVCGWLGVCRVLARPSWPDSGRRRL